MSQTKMKISKISFEPKIRISKTTKPPIREAKINNTTSDGFNIYLQRNLKCILDEQKNIERNDKTWAYKNSYTQEDDIFILEMRSFISNNLLKFWVDFKKTSAEKERQQFDLSKVRSISLENTIILLQNEIKVIQNQNIVLLEKLARNFNKEKKNMEIFNCKNDYINSKEVLQDLFFFNVAEEQFLTYLENKQQSNELLKDNKNGSQRDVKYVEENACQICNEGDYFDDNLIVFCSVKSKKIIKTLKNFKKNKYAKSF